MREGAWLPEQRGMIYVDDRVAAAMEDEIQAARKTAVAEFVEELSRHVVVTEVGECVMWREVPH